MKFKVVILSIISLVLFALPSLPASAYYVMPGRYWNEGLNDTHFYIESNVSVYSWLAWYNAHEEWNEASNSPTDFVYTDYLPRINAKYDSEDEVIWEGRWEAYPAAGCFEQFDVFLNEAETDNYPYYKRVAVAAHEFGHSIGLDHNPEGNCIMNSSAGTYYDATYNYWPQSVDIYWANYIY